jgi:excisionase family DNA binding protein
MRDAPDTTASTVGAPPPAGPLLVTVEEAGQILCLSRSTVYRLIDTGDLEVVHIGRAVRVPCSALVAFVDRLRTIAEPVSATHG